MFDLKKRRIELGLTMLEVAKLVGVSEATISRYESGNIRNMRRDRIEKYAKALRVRPSEFLNIDEDYIKTHELLKTLHNPENTSEQVKEQDRFIDNIIKGTPIKKDRSAVIERINNLPDDQYEKFAERLEGYLDGLEDQ